MPDTIAVPKSIIVTVIAALIMTVVGMIVYKAQNWDSAIQTNQQAIMVQDKAIGVVQEWSKGHEKNKSAHHE